jgi:hypothetical protein
MKRWFDNEVVVANLRCQKLQVFFADSFDVMNLLLADDFSHP